MSTHKISIKSRRYGQGRRRTSLHSFGSTRLLFWIRYNGQIHRFLSVTDFSVIDEDYVPRQYVKRHTKGKFRPGRHLGNGNYTQEYAAQYANLPADQWVEIV